MKSTLDIFMELKKALNELFLLAVKEYKAFEKSIKDMANWEEKNQ